MFKLVVLSALLAIAATRPGLLYGGARFGYEYSAPAPVAVAALTSVHSSGTEIIHPPTLRTYAAAPAAFAAPFAHAAIAAPVAHAAIAAPLARAAIAAPLAYVAAPALSLGHGYAANLGYGYNW